MRKLSFGHYVAATVPIVAVLIGIRSLVHHSRSGDSGKGQTASIKPSDFKKDKGDDASDDSPERAIASANAKKRPQASDTEEDEKADASEDAEDIGAEAAAAVQKDSRPSHALEAALNDVASVGAECARIEYRGDGPQATKVTKGEWITVMDQFHAAKHELLVWLDKHRSQLSGPTAQAMEKQVRDLKIQRPPASEEPDLSWRGIGVFGQNADGDAMIKLGGGFVRLADKHPARARFEMTRLVAQAWAPCELQRLTAQDSTWTPLLHCLGVTENQSCAQGTYSESGWAVSTVVASAVAPPGCQIPALKQSDAARCVSNMPFSKPVAGESRIQRSPAAFAALLLQGQGGAQ